MRNTFQGWLKTKKRRVVGTLTDEEVLRYADEYASEPHYGKSEKAELTKLAEKSVELAKDWLRLQVSIDTCERLGVHIDAGKHIRTTQILMFKARREVDERIALLENQIRTTKMDGCA